MIGEFVSTVLPFVGGVTLAAFIGLGIGSVVGRWEAVHKAERHGINLTGSLWEKYRQLERLIREEQ